MGGSGTESNPGIDTDFVDSTKAAVLQIAASISRGNMTPISPWNLVKEGSRGCGNGGESWGNVQLSK